MELRCVCVCPCLSLQSSLFIKLFNIFFIKFDCPPYTKGTK